MAQNLAITLPSQTVASPSQEMLSLDARSELERQAYRIVGNHSAVKVCGWTKNMVNGEGGCYKLKFYGIMSNQCMQMTTSISCANRCTFCWRGYKAPVSKEWKWSVDDPKEINDGSLKAHRSLLAGFKGSPKVNKTAYQLSETVKHVALSLTGEPIMYPRINETIADFHRRGISTFLVTRAQYPEQIRDLAPVTQLYVSLDGPTKDLMKKIDVPLFEDYWERCHKSLEEFAKKKHRTCVRLTLIKGMNDGYFQEYADLIHKSNTDFIEVKSYMHVGASVLRLQRTNMALHGEVVAFSQKLVECLPEYEIVSEHVPSRVVMLAKKIFKKEGLWYTWIDFPKFHELVNSGKEFTKMDYLRRTPNTGIQTKPIESLNHQEQISESYSDKKLNVVKDTTLPIVDEKTQELSFWNNA